jgi:hypothetical protein
VITRKIGGTELHKIILVNTIKHTFVIRWNSAGAMYTDRMITGVVQRVFYKVP